MKENLLFGGAATCRLDYNEYACVAAEPAGALLCLVSGQFPPLLPVSAVLIVAFCPFSVMLRRPFLPVIGGIAAERLSIFK